MDETGLLIVLSGPSGVGKGTICDQLLQNAGNQIKYSISMTTRPPRAGETDGVDYHFVSREKFCKMIEEDELLEWAEVYGNFYGTPEATVDAFLAGGKDVLLEIDIQGALQVKEKRPEGVFIFLLPPSLKELQSRIKKRGTESEIDLDKRIRAAREEIRTALAYDYVLVNQDVDHSVEMIQSIVNAEKSRVNRVGEKIVEEVIFGE